MSSTSLLRPLSIAEILDRAIRLYRSHFVLLLSIPLVVMVPMIGLQVAVQFIWHTTRLIALFQNAFIQILVSSALVVAISQAYLAQPPTLGEAYRVAGSRYWSVWGGSLLMGLAIGAPIFIVVLAAAAFTRSQGIWLVILLVLPWAAFFGTRWNLMLPSIVLEKLGPQAGLGRSWTLTDGWFWKVFGTSFLAGILISLLTTLPQLLIVYGLNLFLSNLDIGALVQIILSQGSLILTLPISVGVTVVLYYDLRVRREGFDLEWQVQQTSPENAAVED